MSPAQVGLATGRAPVAGAPPSNCERVLILLPSFERISPAQGALAFASFLRGQGVDCTIGALERTSAGRPSLVPEAGALGVRCHSFDLPGWAGLAMVGRIRRFLARESIDAVVSYTFMPDVVNALLPSSVARFTTLREHLATWHLNYGRIIGEIMQRVSARASARVDGVFVLTHEMRRQITERGINPDRVHVVKNFIDVEAVAASGAPAVRLEDGALHVGFFGLLIALKRVDVALRAVAEVARRAGAPPVILHVAGVGPRRADLESLSRALGIADRTVFHGYVRNVPPLMAGMDVIVLPSEAEGTSRALLEAMALGRTCVAAEIAGMDELIDDGRTGYLVPPNDERALADRLERIAGGGLLDPASVREHVRTHHDVRVCAAQMWSVIRTAIVRPRS